MTKSASTIGRLAATAAIAGGALAVGLGSTASADDPEPPPPAMSMCHIPTTTGYLVVSRVENRSANDVIHRNLVETEVVPGEQYEMRVTEERTVVPGTNSVMMQTVLGDRNGPYPIGRTYASTATDAETGAETPFYYRNYHIEFVMDPC